MRVGRRALLVLITLVVFLIGFVGSVLAVEDLWFQWGYIVGRPGGVLLFLLLILGVPGAGAAWAGRVLSRRWRLSWAWQPSRGFRVLALLGYAATAVAGVPAAMTAHDEWAVSEYKRLRAAGAHRVWDSHPYIATYLAVPVLPGFILSYHEYQLAGLYGFGGFDLSVWYGVGTCSVGELPLWVS